MDAQTINRAFFTGKIASKVLSVIEVRASDPIVVADRDGIQHIALRFDPKQIILFGSHAYGRPTAESDVDLLVVMDKPVDEMETMVEIDCTKSKVRIDISTRQEKVDTQRGLITAEYDDIRPFVATVISHEHLLAEKVRPWTSLTNGRPCLK